MKDFKLAQKRGLDENKLNEIILKLIKGEELPSKSCDHNLSADYKGFRECHISPDWLLIYGRDITVKIITLIRTSTHFDLF